MKQSTKLLSLVLALVMAFSCMTVIGNAASTISSSASVTYDSIDDALLTPEQVADIALDLVDGLLLDADLGVIEIDAVITTITIIDLTSVDRVLDSLYELATGALFGIASGLVDAGDVENLTFDGLKVGSRAVQRSDGNLQVVYHFLAFLNENADVLKKAVYGIESGDSRGITLGIIGSVVDLDLGEINDILCNLKGFVGDMLYDLLLFGSYRHPLDAEELKAAGQSLPYGGSIDHMLENAVLNLVVDPQDYDYDEETDEKIWDENSVLIPSLKAKLGENEANRSQVLADLDLNAKSVFDVINYVAQYAIDDLGVVALNNNLKKGLMEAVEVEFNEIEKEAVPAEVLEVFDNEAAYTTYIGYDCLEKSDDGEWFYTTKKTQDVLGPNGLPLKDEDGNIVTERVRVYFKANTNTANDFYNLINWDYEILKSTDANANSDAAAGLINCLDYNYFVTGENGYGSIVESLNHIIYIVYENALTDEVKADFEAVTGAGWVDGATSGTLDVDGKTEKILNYNINRLVKYLLANFADMMFGSDSAYADKETYTYDGFWADKTIIDIAAILGPSFFADAMPQLVMPVDENGAYAFATSENGASVALLQFGAIVLREFMTEIAPAVNYDAFIFAEGTLTSAEGRQFANHTADEWFNLILNMGVDIGYTYLGNITNFGDKFTFTSDGTALATKTWRTTTLPAAPTAETAVSESRWMGMLDEAILWAVGYVGQGANGVLTGINPNTVAAIEGPFNKLSYVLNKILPLGFVNGCESANYDLDVEIVFNKLKTLLTTFDLTQLASLFGRNGIDGSTLKRGNILAQPVIPMVLNLVNDILNLVFGAKIFPATDALDNVLKQENLSTVVETLLVRLNAVKEPLLLSALPVVGKLIKGWGTEQNFSKPAISAPTVVELSGGATKEETIINVKNGADGIWRSWIDANGTRQYDEQYQIELTGVKFYDFETGNQLTNISAGSMTTGKINYGKSGTFVLNVSGQTTSKIVRMDVSYKVYEGNTEMVAGAVYTDSVYSYLTAVATDEGTKQAADQGQFYFGTWSPRYIDISGEVADIVTQIENADLLYFIRESDHGTKLKGGTTFTSSSDDAAVKPGNGSISAELGAGGSSSTRYWEPLEIMKNGTYTCTGKKTDKDLVVSGASIDGTAVANKTPGSKTNLTFSVAATADNCNKDAYSATAKATLVYYDGETRNDIANDITAEIKRGRIAADYLTTGSSYADRVLATETTIDEVTGEEILKETNFTETAWVDQDGEPLAAGITVTPNEDNEEIGTYVIDGQKYSAKLVTKIDNSKVWNTYVAAVKAAASAGLDGLNINGIFQYGTILEDLNAAATDISFCEADVDGDPTVANAIAGLKTTLDAVEEATTDRHDYTDYMMWRLNRLNDAREDASYYIDLKKDSDRAYANVDKKFPYTSIEKDDLQALVALEANAEALNGNGDLVLALLEDLTEDEAKAKKTWLEDRDKEFANVTAFDIALAKSLLEKTSQRLRDREYKVNGVADTTILETEIASAEAMFTDSSLYTERSWTKYAAALEAAKAVVKGDSQMEAFDAKWELLCCRNELVLVEDEADYSELEALIAQAEYALSHQDKYDNTAKELGQVLAELGIEGDIVTAAGYGINLFPGSAVYTNAEPYTTDDQDIIDNAADQLKEALARLKFYNVGITAVEGEGEVDYAGETTIVFDDPETKDIDESVVVKLATIGAGLDETGVKALFNVTATGATVGADNVTVSNDRHYSMDKYVIDEETGEKVLAPFKGFAGTNSVVTFYTVQDGIKIPVATIKLVVNGDINGDGTVDVIDAAQMHLAANEMATLEGCYFLAGNLAGATDDTRVIDGDDYTQIINAVVA